MTKKVIFWVLAVFISLSIMVYQRLTGPTYEKEYELVYNGTEYKFDLPRSHGGNSNCPVQIGLPEPFQGELVYRRFPTEEPWDTLKMARDGSDLVASLPHQPPAGKLEYHLNLKVNGKIHSLGDKENIVIRFKGSVPAWAQIPHILLMILTVICSTAIIFFAAANLPHFKKYLAYTIILLILGGFVFGPVVQYYAFGQFWTGWPFGQDLTDNKVLLALIAFLIAWFLRHKSYAKWMAIAAAIIMLAVYLIPHSMNGSELDPETGQVITGIIFPLLVKINNDNPNFNYFRPLKSFKK